MQSFADGIGFYNTLWQRPYFPKNDVIEIAETGAKIGDQCGEHLSHAALKQTESDSGLIETRSLFSIKLYFTQLECALMNCYQPKNEFDSQACIQATAYSTEIIEQFQEK